MVESKRLSSNNQDTVDLHGTTAAEAIVIVKEILQSQGSSQSTHCVQTCPPISEHLTLRQASKNYYWSRCAFCEPGQRSQACCQESPSRRRVGCRRLGWRPGRSRKTLVTELVLPSPNLVFPPRFKPKLLSHHALVLCVSYSFLSGISSCYLILPYQFCYFYSLVYFLQTS